MGSVIKEKRKRQRIGFHSSIEIETQNGKEIFESLNNLSMDGFFLITNSSFTKNRDYNFNLKLTCGSNVIEILGKCAPIRFTTTSDNISISSQDQGIGFKITYLEPESSEELYNVVKYNTLD